MSLLVQGVADQLVHQLMSRRGQSTAWLVAWVLLHKCIHGLCITGATALQCKAGMRA